MRITETLLTKQEKRALRKALITRVIVFFLFILPILMFTVYIFFLAVMSFAEDNQDMFSYVVPVLCVLFYLAAGKFILPHYRNMFRYAKARTKQVIEATVLDVYVRHNSRLVAFEIETDYCHINTARNVIFFHDLPFLNLYQGMKICIHIIPGMENEILRISACPDDTQPFRSEAVV